MQIKGTLNRWKKAFPVWDTIILGILSDLNKEK